MRCCLDKLSEIISFIVGSDIDIKECTSENSLDKNLIEITVKDKYKYLIETYEKNENKLKEIKEKVEKILTFEVLKQEEQMLKQARENFINDVVHFRFEDIDSMLSRSEILNFDFYIKRIAIIIEIVDMYMLFKNTNELILQELKEDMYEIAYDVYKSDKDIISYIGSNRFVICKSESEDIYEKTVVFYERLKEEKDLNVKIAIGDYYDLPGIEGMGYSFKDAEKYITVGKKFLPHENIYKFSNVGIFLTISNLPKFEKEKLMKYTKQLAIYDEKNKLGILEFLEKFFINNLSLTKTEEELNIPKNKAKHILTEIKKITGLEPINFEDAVKLYLSLKILK